MSSETAQKPEIFTVSTDLTSAFQGAFYESGLRSGKHGWRTIKSWDDFTLDIVGPVFVAFTIKDVDHEKARFLSQSHAEKAFLLFQGDLPSCAVADRVAWLGVRDDRRIHYTEREEEPFARRLLSALDSGDCEKRIVDAKWEGETLLVVSAKENGFDKLRVPLDKLPVLRGCNNKTLEQFDIDEDGAFIYWPRLDVHLSWEQFEQAIDEKALLKAQQQSDSFNKAYGSAIRKFRKKSALRQSDIKGLTPRQVGRIERGECRATHNAISKFAKAHNMSTSDYMGELANLLET